jgi:hypothetical protein
MTAMVSVGMPSLNGTNLNRFRVDPLSWVSVLAPCGRGSEPNSSQEIGQGLLNSGATR